MKIKTYRIVGIYKATREEALKYINENLEDKIREEKETGTVVKVLDKSVEKILLYRTGETVYSGCATYTFLKDDKPLILGDYAIEGEEKQTENGALESLLIEVGKYKREYPNTDIKYISMTITESVERGTFKAKVFCYFPLTGDGSSDFDGFLREKSREVQSWSAWKQAVAEFEEFDAVGYWRHVREKAKLCD